MGGWIGKGRIRGLGDVLKVMVKAMVDEEGGMYGCYTVPRRAGL